MTLDLPLKLTGRFVPGTMAAPLICRPANTPSKVTGLTPKAFDRRRRVCRPQMSGCTISRNVWSRAPVSAEGKAKLRLGWADAFPAGYGP